MERLAVSRLIPPPVHPEDDPPMARGLGVLVSLLIPAVVALHAAPSAEPRRFAFGCVAGALHGVYVYWAWRARVYLLPKHRRTVRGLRMGGWGRSGYPFHDSEYKWRRRWMYTPAGRPIFVRLRIAKAAFLFWTFGGLLFHLFLKGR